MLRSGKIGWNDENATIIEYSLKLDSNPEFSSSVIVAYACAAYRLLKQGEKGCKTVFDIAPKSFSLMTGEEMQAKLM